MHELLYGAPICGELESGVLTKIAELKSKGIIPCIATFRIGEEDDDVYYERAIAKRASEYEIKHHPVVLDDRVTMEEAVSNLESLNEDPGVDGILLLMPFPKTVDGDKLVGILDPKKDIDAITDTSYISLLNGDREAYHACTASACIRIIKYYSGDMTGKKITVVGRSMRVGKPAALMAINEDATITVCHSMTKREDLISACKSADIVVLATGLTEHYGPEYFSDGQMIIDAGIGTGRDGKIAGDLDVDAIESSDLKDLKYTPVPGGVGAVTTIQLMRNVIKAVYANR